MNLGLWRVWRELELGGPVQLLAQTYDSITFQYPEELEDAIIPQVLRLIAVELVAPNGRRYVVPGEAKVGWNWGAAIDLSDQEKARKDGKTVPRLNLDGLVKWGGPERPDRRVRTTWRQRDLTDYATGAV
jgi:hypothetical protein